MKLLNCIVLLAGGTLSFADTKSGGVRRASRPGLAAKVKGKIKGSAKKEKDLTSILFPGVTPEEYDIGEEISIFTGQVQSKDTQVPFNYYEMPVCPAPTDIKKSRRRRSIGAKLQGINEEATPYALKVLENKTCTPLCLISISKIKSKKLKSLIERNYRIHVSLDDLPVIMRHHEFDYVVRGYPVGFKMQDDDGDENYYLYNHLRFTIDYKTTDEGVIHITGFSVYPVSIKHDVVDEVVKLDTQIETCNDHQESVINDPSNYLQLKPNDAENQVIYSYEVFWNEGVLEWTDRWDIYLTGSPQDQVHLFGIINSIMVVVFLSCAVSVIMMRILKKDIDAYNDSDMDDEIEEKGWKLVHGDVFRFPKNTSMLLSICVGTGAQIGVAMTITLAFGLFGILNPMNKGETLTTILLLYVLSGSVAGYVSSRLYKFCDGKSWKRATLLTATAFPGLLVTMFLCLDLFLSIAGAATAVSFWTIISLFLLWVCVSTPLVFTGSYFGYRANKIETPTKTNQIARFIPERPWHIKTPNSYFLGGILPFGSVSIEVLFIMAALWLHQLYYAIGFLLFVVIILGITCAEVSVVMTYLKLGSEDHEWWWSAFLNTASTGFYLLIYSIWFLSTKLSLIGFLPILVYFTYMSMISIALGLFCGSIGFLSSLAFTKAIYGAVKVD